MNSVPEDRRPRKAVFGWVMYDWANSAFATTVMAGFFPIFFKDYWSEGSEPTESTFWLGVSVSTASLIVAVLAPLLGAIADRGGTRKRSLLVFAGLGIFATGGLYFVAQGGWSHAAALYIVGIVGFLGSLIFYDALLINVSEPRNVDLVSARGYAFGYLGGGLLFLLNVIAVQHPSLFGLSGPADAVRLSFVSVAIWWALFTIPLVLFVREPHAGTRSPLVQSAREGFRQLRRTLREIRSYKPVLVFLVAYWFYIDGVDTIVTMAVDYGKTIGYSTSDLITALLMVQFLGFPFAYLMGLLGHRWGTKRAILLCIAVYVFVTIFGARLDLEPFTLFGFAISKFYVLAFLVALVQGGIQALSRSYYSRIIPKERAAEFFGFYNMLGKFAAIVGPVMMGTISRLSGSPRIGIFSIAILFVIGAIVLLRVPGGDARSPDGASL
jgi:UMF1 family MFS transporter